jgi:hypothetical protein
VLFWPAPPDIPPDWPPDAAPPPDSVAPPDAGSPAWDVAPPVVAWPEPPAPAPPEAPPNDPPPARPVLPPVSAPPLLELPQLATTTLKAPMKTIRADKDGVLKGCAPPQGPTLDRCYCSGRTGPGSVQKKWTLNRRLAEHQQNEQSTRLRHSSVAQPRLRATVAWSRNTGLSLAGVHTGA